MRGFLRLYVCAFAVICLGGCAVTDDGEELVQHDGAALSDIENDPITRMSFVEMPDEKDGRVEVVLSQEVAETLSSVQPAAGGETDESSVSENSR